TRRGWRRPSRTASWHTSRPWSGTGPSASRAGWNCSISVPAAGTGQAPPKGNADMATIHTVKNTLTTSIDRKLLIRGRATRTGRVSISGAKNSAVAVLPACILAEGTTVLQNVPDIADVAVQRQILAALGAEVSDGAERGEVRVTVGAVGSEVPYGLGKLLRGSVLLLGALVARCGEARVPLPGGCAIGSRPLDLHLKGLRELGAEVDIEHGFIVAKAPRLVGTGVYLDFPSVGATENLMMAATAAKGTTVIYNAAKEPEVVDLANFLNAMGARIIGAGTDTIKIEGQRELRPTTYSIIPDRIEAGTYLLMGLVGG